MCRRIGARRARVLIAVLAMVSAVPLSALGGDLRSATAQPATGPTDQTGNVATRPTTVQASAVPHLEGPPDLPHAVGPTNMPHLAAQRTEPTPSPSQEPTPSASQEPTDDATSYAAEDDSDAWSEPSTLIETVTETATVTAAIELSPPPATATAIQMGADEQPAELAAGVTEVAQPRRLNAAASDVERAAQADPVTVIPPPASPAEVNRLRNLVTPPGQPDADAARRVMQWQPDWVQYDSDSRPVIINAFPDPLTVFYEVDGQPRLVEIPPLGRVVTEVPEPGSYSFIAVRTNILGLFLDAAVGSFFGGGYAAERVLTDAAVQVKYTDAMSGPMGVRKLVDVGADPTVGEDKVLLDGATPAWGEWKRNDAGGSLFEIHKTQTLPGLQAPAEGPLAGYHDVQLTSTAVQPARGGGSIGTVAAAAGLGLAVGAIATALALSKRRRA